MNPLHYRQYFHRLTRKVPLNVQRTRLFSILSIADNNKGNLLASMNTRALRNLAFFKDLCESIYKNF